MSWTVIGIVSFALQVIGVKYLLELLESWLYRAYSGGWSRDEEATMLAAARTAAMVWAYRYRQRAVKQGHQGHTVVILLGDAVGFRRELFDSMLVPGWKWEEFDGELGDRKVRGLVWRHKIQAFCDADNAVEINRDGSAILRAYDSMEIGIVSIQSPRID